MPACGDRQASQLSPALTSVAPEYRDAAEKPRAEQIEQREGARTASDPTESFLETINHLWDRRL